MRFDEIVANCLRACRPVRQRTMCVVLGLALTQMIASAVPESSDVEIRIKAAFIYNFARFVEWPPKPNAGPVKIGVIGHGDLASPLEEVIRGKSVSGRPIKLTQIGSPAEVDAEILLIEHSESKHAKDIAQALAGKPVLTVSDDENTFSDGVMIVFQLVDETVRFQINQEAAARAGLKISSQLLKVAIPAQGRRQ